MPGEIVNREKLELFAGLSQTAYGDKLIEYLRKELAKQDKDNRTLLGEILHQGQGKAQCLSVLLDALEQSHSVLQAHK